MTPEQARAARAILKLGVRAVAAEVGVTPNTVSRLEAGDNARALTINAVQRFYEDSGIEFIPENGGGAGVRMKK